MEMPHPALVRRGVALNHMIPFFQVQGRCHVRYGGGAMCFIRWRAITSQSNINADEHGMAS